MSAKCSQLLVVDDDPNYLAVLSHLLDRKGYNVLVASDGIRGVQRAVSDQPDLILLDVMMPDMDGFETCRQLKTDENTRDIPVIFMTGLSDTGDKVRGFKCGAIDYITKPVKSEEVLARINTHLSMQKLRKDLHKKNQDLLEKYDVVSKQMNDLRLNLSLYLPHELRTPLTAILGFSELLLSLGPERLPKPNEILDLQTFIHDNTLRLKCLVENYLLYARLRLMENDPEGKYRGMWQSDDFFPTETVITSVAMSKAEKAQRQEDLRLDLVEAEIRFSERSLQKIVEQLLDNAFKFSEPSTPVQVTTSLNSHQWMLKITDQGRGMTAEQIGNIGAYMQFGRKYYEQQGSGLGLIIAHFLAQLNDGELTIESVPNQGTTVMVVCNRKD